MLWEWDRHNNLSAIDTKTAIDTKKIGIAFLAETIYLSGHDFSRHCRQTKLVAPDSAYLEAVIHIESDYRKKLEISQYEMEKLVSAISRCATCPKINSLQIDFDARETEREFYKNLLYKIRRSIPKNFSLSITALASWCMGDRWVENLPVTDIVPMLFSMGTGADDVILYIKMSKRGQLKLLQKCLGVSPEEFSTLSLLKIHLTKRPQCLYFFSAHPWTAKSINSIIKEASAW